MQMTRREHLAALASLPLIFYSYESTPKIIEFTIKTEFNLDQVFEHGSIYTYELISIPDIHISVKYDNNTIRKFLGHHKTWHLSKKYDRDNFGVGFKPKFDLEINQQDIILKYKGDIMCVIKDVREIT